MTGFLYDIRSLFGAKHSGKYMSLLLRELAFQDPRSFVRIFGIPKNSFKDFEAGKLQIVKEWRFDVNGRRKFADLAILDGGEPILLFEVKEDDFKNPSNAKQLQDYLAFVRMSRNVRFVHLSRYRPVAADIAVLSRFNQNEAVSFKYRDIYEKLHQIRNAEATPNPYLTLLLDYLKDIGIVTYNVIDLVEERKELEFFLAQILGFPHKQGLGRLSSVNAVNAMPELMKRMFGNMEIVGNWFKEHNSEHVTQRFSRKLRPEPYYDLGKLSKSVEDYDETDTDPEPLPGSQGRFLQSGTIYFTSSGVIRSYNKSNVRNWLSCELAFGLSLQRSPEKRNESVYVTLYAGFEGRNLKWTGADRYFTKFPSENQALGTYAKLLEKARAKACLVDINNNHKVLTKLNFAN